MAEELTFTVKHLISKTEHAISIASTQKGAALKQQIREKFGFAADDGIKVLNGGKVIRDDETLLAQSVKSGSKLHVTTTTSSGVQPSSSQSTSTTSTGFHTASASTNAQSTRLTMTEELQAELKFLLRPHFTADDCQKIIAEYSRICEEGVAKLSLDDIERYAKQTLAHGRDVPLVIES